MAGQVDPFRRLLGTFGEIAPAAARGARDEGEAEVVREVFGTIDRFCSQELGRLDRDARLPAEVVDRAAELGLFGLTVPAEHGGAGLGMQAVARIIARLASFDGSLATTVGLHSGLALRPLVSLGTPAQKARYLPEVALGRRIAAVGGTEPEAGSDLSSIRTTATVADGRLIVTGEKAFVTNSAFAGLFTVLARTPGLGGAREGTSLLLVDLLDPELVGVRRLREEHKLGLKGSSTTSIALDEARVPMDHLLGEPGRGLEHFRDALSWGRTFLSAGCVGSAEGAIRQAVEHVRTRRQFGRTLSRFGMVRERVARMRAQELAMQAVLSMTTALQESGEDIGWVSTVAKILCSESSFEVIDSSLQLHGGMGYIEETGVARRLRDCRVTRIFEGANDVLKLHLASACLMWDLGGLAAVGPLEPHVGPELAPLAARVDPTLAQVLAALAERVKRLGVRLVDRQLEARRIADLLVDCYALACAFALVRGRRERGRDPEPDQSRLTLLVELTLPRLRAGITGLAENADPAVEPVARVDLD
ncbi:MAG: acyl-CoA dehydrogenase family protein [Deltaproteobacteria bacterium]|nr:acyl-CoA dehydrogenase family protein [Deltaproteobacteria bacterium]